MHLSIIQGVFGSLQMKANAKKEWRVKVCSAFKFSKAFEGWF